MPTPHSLQRLILAAASALCLSLLPSLAAAQATGDDAAAPKPKTTPAKKKAKTTAKPAEAAAAAKPAPAVEKAAAVEKPAPVRREEAPPPPRPARTHTPRPPADPAEALLGKLEIEGSLGLGIPFESGINTGFKVDVAAFYGFRQLAPNMVLQLGANVGWEYHGLGASTYGVDGSFMFFDFLPTARLRFILNEKMFAYADGGLGLGIVRFKLNATPLIGFTASSTDAAFLLKLGGGFGYDVTPQISLVGAPALNIYMKSGSSTVLTLLVGAIYKL